MEGYNTYQSNNAGPSQLQKLSSNIGSNIQKISQNVKSIQQLVNQLGTDQDNTQLRSQLHQVQHYTGGLAKDTNTELRNFQNAPIPPTEDSRAWRLQVERLTKLFTEALNSFQSVQRQAANKEKEALKLAKASSDAHYFDEGGSALVDLGGGANRGQTVQLHMDQQLELEAIHERESQIRQLESDIMDVNQIFKDLATMVHEQGEVIDSIEANVESASTNVSTGATELRQALTYQNKARRKKVCLVITGVIIICVIIGIIAYASQ